MGMSPIRPPELNIQLKKQKALDFFVKELLKPETRKSIAKIVLFGSLLKGEPKEESDIDLLVITTDSSTEISNACADASFETAMATGESVEPLVRCVDDIRYPQSYFLYSVIGRGKEIYRMDGEELRRKEARNYLNLSSEYLDGARANSQRGYFRIAVDAAYNACELAIKGLLLLRLPDIPGSHGGIVNKFGELYVKAGDVPKEMGRGINLALEKRNNARYEPHVQISKDQAEEIIDLGEKLQGILEKKIVES
jgi:uncharacterized protein (UPF0332 family)/predicted nucleotidyltransferase